RPRYMLDRVQVKKLVAIPTTALTHIQNRAPGPPIAIATATPAILPIPTVDASAVDTAWKGDSCPGPLVLYLPRRTSIAWKKYLYGTKPEYTKKKRPPPISRNSSGKPQSQLEKSMIACSIK